MSPQLIELDTLSKQMSVYFFMTNTNKVRSDKMIQMYRRIFMIKILFFININLPSFSRLEDDTHIKCS